MSQTPQTRESWNTRIGVILAVAGSAVGLGNFLRFPGKAAEYGGGAFMIPYAVAFILLGLPIAWTEWSMGRYGGARGFNSAPGVFRVIWRHRAAPYFGLLGPLIPIIIYMYYVFIEAWCLGYAWYYLVGGMRFSNPQEAGAFFETFTGSGADANGVLFTGDGIAAVVFLAICFVLNFFLIYRGLNKGIEWFCKLAMPALIVCALIVLVRVLTLGTPDANKPEQTVINGLGYMWNPVHQAGYLASGDVHLQAALDQAGGSAAPRVADGRFTTIEIKNPTAWGAALGSAGWEAHENPSGPDVTWRHPKSRLRLEVAGGLAEVKVPGFVETLSNPEVWLEAAGQIFFSLSVGFGIVITYASYLRKDDDVALSSLTACAGNGFCEVALGGLITIPAAFMFLGASAVANPPGTFGMGFVSLPSVFQQMPAGRVIGFLFFFLLFLAAVTSSLSMLQPAIALLEEGLGLGRKASVVILGFITAVGSGFVVYFSAGFVALDTLDFWVGQLCIYIMATIQVILFGWVMGIDRGMEELDSGAEIRLPRFIKYMIKYVAPIYLLTIFVMWLIQNAPQRIGAIWTVEEGQPPVVALSIGLILAVGIFLTLLIARSSARWDRAENAQTGVSP